MKKWFPTPGYYLRATGVCFGIVLFGVGVWVGDLMMRVLPVCPEGYSCHMIDLMVLGVVTISIMPGTFLTGLALLALVDRGPWRNDKPARHNDGVSP